MTETAAAARNFLVASPDPTNVAMERVRVEIFIQANDNQLVAAKVAKFALETRGRAGARGIPVTIMNVDEMPLFEAFSGVAYRCGGQMIRYDRRHVQSFTLSRFLPPEIMSFSGRALVIDPDVLAVSDIDELLSLDFGGQRDRRVSARHGLGDQRHAAGLREASALED